MTLPRVAIVGRPNVGKSALFNRIVGQRISIVDSEEGVTRDRLLHPAECFGRPFEVIDTGGIARQSPALFHNEIQAQTQWAIREADALIFVVDGQVGITEHDHEVAKQLRKIEKPLLIAVNKIDHPSQAHLSDTFFSLGISTIVPISCQQGWQIAELLEALLDKIDPGTVTRTEPKLPLAIVGRPNVGKSTLINTLLDESRCIVSPIPGTTRDSIDIPFTYNDATYTLIDTAGIRKKKGEKEVVDKFAAIRTERAIERAKVCLLLLDAERGITSHDKRIARRLEEEGKGCVLLLNKWDLVKGFRMEACFKELYEEVPFLRHCPKLFISAKMGRNLDKIFPLVQEVFTATTTRITTHQLNKTIEQAMQKTHPPMITGKRLRVYYLTQVSIEPPTFVLFVNNPQLMTQSYHKYLINQLRQAYTFSGTPIRLHLRGKHEDSSERN